MTSTSQKTLHPTVLWAQRDSILYVTIEVDDMKISDLTISDKTLHVKSVSFLFCHLNRGTNGTGSTDYEATLDFYGEVKGEEQRRIASGRHVELVIPKATNGWWPRLLKNAAKVPWVKVCLLTFFKRSQVDFNKWKDEDDDEYSGGGGMGGGGGGMGGMGGDFDFNDYMGKMGGGGGGMGNFNAPGIDDDFDGEGEDSEDDMPELEDTDGKSKTTTTDSSEVTTVDGEQPGPSTTTGAAETVGH